MTVTAGVPEQTLRLVTRRLMPFLFVLYVIAYIDRINIGFAGLQMTGELHFSDKVFGLGSGVFFVGYLLLGIPGAILVEQWSARKMMATTLLVWGFVASMTGFIHTTTEFYSMRFLLGLTEAGFFPGVITYLGHWFRPQDRAKAVAMFMAAIPVSQVVAAPLSAALMKVHWFGFSGWRWLLILEGVPAVLAGIASFVYLTDWPSEAGWLNPEQRQWLTATLEGARGNKTANSLSTMLTAFKRVDVLLLCGVYFGGTVGNYGLGLWMPKMLQRMGGLSVSHTALLSALPAIAAIPAMLICGWHSDRTGERRWHTAIPRFTAAVALALATMVTSNLYVGLTLFAIGFAGILAAYPSLWTMPTAFLGATAAAASIGLINAFGNLGGFAGPYLIGYFGSTNGAYAGGLWTMAISLFFSGALVLLIRKRADSPSS